MKFQKSLVNYGKTIISQETLAELQYSPTGFILKPSTSKVLITGILGALQERTQSMKQFYTVAFATNMLSIMIMIMTTIHPGILMMDTHLMLPVQNSTTNHSREPLLTIQGLSLAQTPSISLENLVKNLKILPSNCSFGQNSQSQKKRTLLPLQKLQLVTIQKTPYSKTLRIRMMVTIQTVIKVIQNGSGYYSSTAPVTVHEQYPHLAGFQTDHYSSTEPVIVDEQYFRKAKGHVTIHEQYQLVFIYSARHNNLELLFAFNGKGFHLQ